MAENKVTPEEQFDTELSAVFVRWIEESDLTEDEMATVAKEVTERFCDTEVEFKMDFDLDDIDDED